MSISDLARRMAATAAHAAQDKLASNIAAIDVSDVLAITEVFVLASADNERQVGSIVDEVEDQMTAEGFEPQRREGNRENRWVLLDYGNFVVHIQREAEREFYGLDRLYADCPAIEVEGLEPYERPATFGNEAELREAQNIEDLPLAGDGPAAADDEF